MYNSWKSDTEGKELNCIGYSQSDDGFSWSDERVVLSPDPDTQSWEHIVNRPAVIIKEKNNEKEIQQEEYQMVTGEKRHTTETP